ncbi:Chitin synthase, class 3 [Allomyces arbusculus]|nr:Chitin synthase, class 3 [Allomyces arbusculus]
MASAPPPAGPPAAAPAAAYADDMFDGVGGAGGLLPPHMAAMTAAAAAAAAATEAAAHDSGSSTPGSESASKKSASKAKKRKSRRATTATAPVDAVSEAAAGTDDVPLSRVVSSPPPPSAADADGVPDDVPLAVAAAAANDDVPLALAQQKRRSMYSDHRRSLASLSEANAPASGPTGSLAPPPPPASSTSGPATGVGAGYAGVTSPARASMIAQQSTQYAQAQYQQQQQVRPQTGQFAAAMAPTPPLQQAQAMQQQPAPQHQDGMLRNLARRISGRRNRPDTVLAAGAAQPAAGGAVSPHQQPSDLEAVTMEMTRKRSLVRRERAHAKRTILNSQESFHSAGSPGNLANNRPLAPYGNPFANPRNRGYTSNPSGPGNVAGHAPTAPNGAPLPPSISRRPMTLPRAVDYSRPTTMCRRVWVVFSKVVTFYAIPPVLACFGLKTPEVQLAWREKMALCTIILIMMTIVGFLTFGFNQVLCQSQDSRMDFMSLGGGYVVINGYGFDVTEYNHNFGTYGQFPFEEIYASDRGFAQRDLSFLFQNSYGGLPECQALFGGEKYTSATNYLFPCTISGLPASAVQERYGTYPPEYCHQSTNTLVQDIADFRAKHKRRDIFVKWDALLDEGNPFLAFNGEVVDLSRLDLLAKKIDYKSLMANTGVDIQKLLARYRNRDASYAFSANATLNNLGTCLTSIARVGSLDSSTVGCIASDVVLWVSLIVILALVLSRFFMALIFRWVLSPRLGKRLSDDEKRTYLRQRNVRDRDAQLLRRSTIQGPPFSPFRDSLSSPTPPSPSGVSPRPAARFSFYETASQRGSLMFAPDGSLPPHPASPFMPPEGSPRLIALDGSGTATPLTRPASVDSASTLSVSRQPLTQGGVISLAAAAAAEADKSQSDDGIDISVEEVMHCILLVTCYSEGEEGIRATLNSLARTHYLDTHKILFVIADGMITGAGEARSTPEIVVSLMEKDPAFPDVPKPYSYVAIADGAKRHNMAQVHAGYYVVDGHRVPMVCVAKCGTPDEQSAPKPGNRGKRDSQIVLMSFLQKVMFDERMTPLEYDLFQKIHRIARVTPDAYEMVLMVDADTEVAPDSLERMVASFARDPAVMGLCGETQIANKWGSWVTMIQVFEYYISHHLAKAFESVFGGVTCLPGCFCAYRIKTPKGDFGRHWVPILANPDIVEEYSENVVDTLHKKNLYLLGEDRYLTTLMLRTFPKRKMIFVPQATCETLVPDEFKVLLSQRRRWINSTIHNLMELVLVRDLCGTFCISMQFVIFMELVGTVVLPAAISFTIYLVVISFITTPVPVIPLLLLAAVLGLPGVLILLTSRKIQFVFWMIVYIISLPVWNFILPAYAFWHFDDFSWGATRQVAGMSGKDGHGADDGEFDSTKIIMKRYAEWEMIKRRAIAQALEQQQQLQRRQTAMMTAAANGGVYYGVPNQLVHAGSVVEFNG